MNVSLRQIFVSLLALTIALADIILIGQNQAAFGELPLLLRALATNVAVLGALVALYPLYSTLQLRLGAFLAVVCIPAMLPALAYYLVLLPARAEQGILIEQLQHGLISDSSSNGIVEIGFAYPIFTPTMSFTNQELFTRTVNVFLRMRNEEGGEALFRGVRADVPGENLSVEATVAGMLSENADYLFNPLVLPPQREVVGKVVFVISNADDGASFTDALRSASSVQLELRDPASGDLHHELPLIRD